MPASVLAAQLYTLRQSLGTPAEIATTLKKVKQIGYDAVQLSGLGKIDAGELGAILDGEGLTCCATHVGLDELKKEMNKVIDEHKLWKCDLTAIGVYRGTSKADWQRFADEYNGLAAKLEPAGIHLGYHNHSHELARYDGQTAMEILLERLNPRIWMEIDTYWIAHGGGDVIQWIDKVAGRIPCVHLKDMDITPDGKQLMAEVGEGNLNWPGILAACRKAKVQWYIVEQDICQRDPLESLAISLKNLKGMGLS